MKSLKINENILSSLKIAKNVDSKWVICVKKLNVFEVCK